MSLRKEKLTFVLKSLNYGGIERLAFNLLNFIAQRQDLSIDLVVGWGKGVYEQEIPDNVRTIDLKIHLENRIKSYISLTDKLTKYFAAENPNYIFSYLPIANICSAIAWSLHHQSSKLILIEQTLLFNDLVKLQGYRHSVKSHLKDNTKNSLFSITLPLAMKLWYPQVTAVVSDSLGLARGIEKGLNLKPGLIKTIYNPVIDKKVPIALEDSIAHPWLTSPQAPVFISVGRFAPQKDHFTLIQAFFLLRKKRPAKLIILGDGELRKQIENLVDELNIRSDVDLPGFVKNPYPYLKQANTFVLSSLWEGLPTVLIEALASGCQVVSTNCQYGPDEILENGKYGWLVPITDTSALSKAMEHSLESPIDRTLLKQRANYFTVKRAANEYLQLVGLSTE
ncbi:glycosyltransferase [Oxynema aestuarii]|uniref:Glycosyltransferase n=1 Tax=Oxynema aestuarii AP17 TaxID=2064643 RepID=A0A6H1U271_9CYAN|nr:glycosyltransferase [Oxynema aestuarii]QIZ72962.1 glycosyltransferase [Oxynema aestuarii AP17]